jgi:hypothetical protein
MSLLNFKMSSKDSDLAKVYGDTQYIDSYIASTDKTTYNYQGIQYFYSSWLEWKNDDEQKTAQVNVEIELPYDVDNETLLDEAFKTSTKIAYTLEAVQGNASVEDTVSAWYQSDYLTFAIFSEGDLVGGEVSAQEDYKDNITDVIIPSYAYADDYYLPITKIADNAFEQCNNLTSIIIPNGVTSIGKWAFSESGLTSVTIPKNVTKLGSYAFHDSDLETIVISANITKLEEEVFSCCGCLTDVVLPSSLTEIGNNSFSECYVLHKIDIPDSVTSIGEYAFWKCEKLTSITIPSRVTSIGKLAFDSCAELTSIYYTGSIEEWTGIVIGAYNDSIQAETVTLYVDCVIDPETGEVKQGTVYKYEATGWVIKET